MLGKKFGETGWDNAEAEESTSTKREYGPRRFWMPAGSTKRIMFLDSEPFCFFEHNLYAITGEGKDKAVCLKKNGIDDRGCPLCDKEHWPSYIGYFSVIDMGDVSYDDEGAVLKGWTSSKGVTYQFGRSLYGAKRGGRDKPGVLPKLNRLASKRGGTLAGTVWDVHRSGGKVESVGDEFEFIERVEPERWKDYLLDLGAAEDLLEIQPIDYGSVIVPKPYEDLQRLVGGGRPSGEGSRSEGADY